MFYAGEEEAPPIPCHVHSGDIVGGRCVGHGKTEAYFFPPLNVPPYNLDLDAIKTRLGLRPGTTKEQVYIYVWILLYPMMPVTPTSHNISTILTYGSYVLFPIHSRHNGYLSLVPRSLPVFFNIKHRKTTR